MSGAPAPAVSVVIPVFQGEGFIRDAIDSVRAQTVAAAEVIVVDDGSTDASGDLARAAAAEWPAVSVIAQANAGQSAARNAGAAAATGDLLTFLDADDRMTPDRLEHQLDHLARNPADDVVIGAELIELDPGVQPPDWLRALSAGRPNPYIFSMIVRRAAFERVGGFDPGRRLAEDIDWIYRARAAGLGIATTTHLYTRRRLHGGNVTTGTRLADIQGEMASLLKRHLDARRALG